MKNVKRQPISEKDSEKLLIEKMELSKRELREIEELYGVSASKILETMQLSKYGFIADYHTTNNNFQSQKRIVREFQKL